MKPTERELRIERDALIAADKWDRRLTSSHEGFEAGYIAGAAAEHDKARNQAIDECKKVVTFYFGGLGTVLPELIQRIESLKTNPVE